MRSVVIASCVATRNDAWSQQSEVPRLINGEYMWCKMSGSLRALPAPLVLYGETTFYIIKVNSR